MTRGEWENNLRWRALEETDSRGDVVPLEQRVEATVETRAGLSVAQIDREKLEPATSAFLRNRAQWLEHHGEGGVVANLRRRLQLPHLPGWLVVVGWLLAGAVGYVMTQLGNERELNLLALPLLGLLLWNAVVMAASLVIECWPRSAAGSVDDLGLVGRVAQKLRRREMKPEQANQAEAIAAVEAAFEKLGGQTAGRLLQRRFRAWLHVAAALVALGSITAMFARGWSREYRVVWESTLLDAKSAGTFFGGLFGPASRVFGVSIPLDRVSAMQRGENLKTEPGDALPWLQLYGGTMLLGVVIPRLLLTLVALARVRQELQAAVGRQGWPGHAMKLLRRVEGGDQELLVLALGQAVDARVRSRWEEWLRELFGGRVSLNVRWLLEGDEDEWLTLWQPENGRVVVVFFMATTPEDEVHGHLVRQLVEILEKKHFEPEITLLMDGVGLEQRWSPGRLADREGLWRERVGFLVTKMVVGNEKGVSESSWDLS